MSCKRWVASMVLSTACIACNSMRLGLALHSGIAYGCSGLQWLLTIWTC